MANTNDLALKKAKNLGKMRLFTDTKIIENTT